MAGEEFLLGLVLAIEQSRSRARTGHCNAATCCNCSGRPLATALS